MTFRRVVYRRRARLDHPNVSCSIYHGHTDTTRRQLRAWNAAVSAWRRLRASESGGLPYYTIDGLLAFYAAELAHSWKSSTFASAAGPAAVAKGF